MTDGKGNKYVRKITDELTKDRRENDDGLDGGIMLEISGPHCPVTSFELYIKHLNPWNEYLFQRQKASLTVLKTSGTTTWWWENAHLGKKLKYRKMQTFPKLIRIIPLEQQR